MLISLERSLLQWVVVDVGFDGEGGRERRMGGGVVAAGFRAGQGFAHSSIDYGGHGLVFVVVVIIIDVGGRGGFGVVAAFVAVDLVADDVAVLFGRIFGGCSLFPGAKGLGR